MPNPLKDFAEWMKKGLDPMAISSKNTYSVMREFQDWIDSIKLLPNVTIHRDYLRDVIIITHNHNYMTKTISRHDIEDSAAPQLLLIQAIGQLMNKTDAEVAQMIHDAQVENMSADILNKNVTSGVYTGNPVGSGNSWISASGGAIGSALNNPFVGGGAGGWAIGANPTTTYLDEEPLNIKLFSDAERRQIRAIKKTIRDYITMTIPIHDLNMDKVVIAGGCFASLINDEIVKDYDVFFLEDDHNRDFMIALVNANNDNKGARHGNSNYMDNDKIEETLFFDSTSIQYITTKYKTREELINHFDFKHCCVSYDWMEDKLFLTREVFELIKAKKLKPNNKHREPKQWRYEKFAERGWKAIDRETLYLSPVNFI